MSEEIQEKSTAEEVDTQQENAEEIKSETGRTFTRADVGKMIAAERSKWESEQSEAIEKAKSEGERLAKLSKDERAKEEENKRLSAIEERERAVAEKEMRIETQTLLTEKGLPSEFLEVVLAPTAEEVKDNIENLRAIFDSAVETRVNERLIQKAPRMGTGSASMTKEQIMAVKDDEERLKLIAAHRNLF